MYDDGRIPGRPIPQADPNRDWDSATQAEKTAEVERLRREYWGDVACEARIAKVYRVWRKGENGEWKIVAGNY